MAANDIILLPSDAPAPLEIYEQEKIHPDNLALLQARLESYRPLSRRERIRLERRLDHLWKQLKQADYGRLLQRRDQLQQEFEILLKAYSERKLEPSEDRITLVAAELEARAIAEEGCRVMHQLDELKPIHREYCDIIERLDAHERMLNDERERKQEERQYAKEAGIIEELMRDTFARTKGCHFVFHDNRGHRHVEIPRFQLSGVDADSHWFLLAASEKQRFGYRSILPYSVDVADLTSERTLENLSVAVGRQIEVRRSVDNTQIYFRVNRLDSPDGLPKYFVYRSMYELYPQKDHDLVPWPVGVFENRRVRWFNLKDDPHVLVAGKSNAGKSNFLNCLIATCIQTHSPQELRIVLIDNKGGVELSHYKGVPHLWGDVVKTLKDVLPKLRQIRAVMEQRLAQLEAVGKKDIYSYNQSVEPDQRMAHILIFIDEMQTLLNRSKWTRHVHHLLAVLASQGRAPGIHLILCTQHPSKEVVPMPVKTNMACFIMFRMSQHASMTLLNEPAPSHLPARVPGRVVVASGMEVDEAQTPFISDEDIASAVRYAVKTFKPLAVPLLEATIAPAEEDTEEAEPIEPLMVASEPEEEDEEEREPVKPKFTEEDVIAITIDNFEGRLSAPAIFNLVKRQDRASRSQVNELVKIVKGRNQVEYGGTVYTVKRADGNASKLVALTDRPTDRPPEESSLPVVAAAD
jgi:hypothetical protein